MTDLKFEILKLLYNAPYNELQYAEILNSICKDANLGTGNQVRNALTDFETAYEKPLISECIGKRAYKLTPYGRLAYEKEYNFRNACSDNKAPDNKEKPQGMVKIFAYLKEHAPTFANLIIKILDLSKKP